MANVMQLKVNGKTVTAQRPEQTLLSFLRDGLGLVGAKDGCSRGQCGACTVIVNGQSVRSCLKKMKDLDGAEVETIEGLEKDGVLHPLQQAFLKLSAYQCGFCTPGMIMRAKWLLDNNPAPTVEEVRQGLKPNICRCTGYKQIV
ncbi:MAG: (2Fe-2S)-binding protein, partial [Oscillospiraceae bacterium]|nr:(2Fe-2S)-binding protein [Oscillospiraceae bacterium]